MSHERDLEKSKMTILMSEDLVLSRAEKEILEVIKTAVT